MPPGISGVDMFRINNNRAAGAVLAISALLVTGCGSSEVGPEAIVLDSSAPPSAVSPSAPAPEPGKVQPLRSEAARGPAANPVKAGEVMTDFGTAILAEVDKKSDAANVVVSPYSIYTVLAMVDQGAKGETAAQLEDLLGADTAGQQGVVTAVDAGMAAALAAGKDAESQLIAQGGAGDQPATARPFAFDVANSLWAQPGLGIKQEFLDAMAAGFGVGMYETDFASDPEKARAVINAWVSEHTADLIPELIPEGVVTVDTVLALVNAIHLSAPWAAGFQASGLAPFTAPSGVVQAATMSVTRPFGYAEGDDWQSVSVPYQGGELAMTVVLPAVGAWDKVGTELPAVLARATTTSGSGDIRLTMPKFTVDTAADLVPVMAVLGVRDLFGAEADLSGIAGGPGDITGSALVHQAVVAVDEDGTEATAATAFLAEIWSLKSVDHEVTVDRPFYFVIHDTTTTAPLFIGQITDPTA
ncbi:serpin family protein [Nakamurella silvestris]|nr:serpin family protein [Nakamurella silvestris]